MAGRLDRKQTRLDALGVSDDNQHRKKAQRQSPKARRVKGGWGEGERGGEGLRPAPG